MSTVDIAELTEKDHKHVLADARNMLEQLGKTSTDFSAEVLTEYGRRQSVLNLPYEECMTLVTGYSIPLRNRVIVEWNKLRSASAAGRRLSL